MLLERSQGCCAHELLLTPRRHERTVIGMCPNPRWLWGAPPPPKSAALCRLASPPALYCRAKKQKQHLTWPQGPAPARQPSAHSPAGSPAPAAAGCPQPPRQQPPQPPPSCRCCCRRPPQPSLPLTRQPPAWVGPRRRLESPAAAHRSSAVPACTHTHIHIRRSTHRINCNPLVVFCPRLPQIRVCRHSVGVSGAG